MINIQEVCRKSRRSEARLVFEFDRIDWDTELGESKEAYQTEEGKNILCFAGMVLAHYGTYGCMGREVADRVLSKYNTSILEYSSSCRYQEICREIVKEVHSCRRLWITNVSNIEFRQLAVVYHLYDLAWKWMSDNGIRHPYYRGERITNYFYGQEVFFRETA